MFTNQDMSTWLPTNGGALPPFAVNSPAAIMNMQAAQFCCAPTNVMGAFGAPFGTHCEYETGHSYADLVNLPHFSLANNGVPPPFGTKFGGNAAVGGASRPLSGGSKKAGPAAPGPTQTGTATRSAVTPGSQPGSGAHPSAASVVPQPQAKAMESSAPEHILFESNVEGIIVCLPKSVTKEDQNARDAEGCSAGKTREPGQASNFTPGRLTYECTGESFYLSFDYEDVLPLASNVLSKFPPYARRGARELRMGDRVSFSVLMHRFKGDARATKIRVTMASLLNDVQNSTQRSVANGDSSQSSDGLLDNVSGNAEAPANASNGDEVLNLSSLSTSSCVPDSPVSTNSAYSALFSASNLVGVGVGITEGSTANAAGWSSGAQPCEVAMHSLALRKFRGTVCIVRDKFGFIERGREHALRHDKNIFFHFSEFHGPVALIRVGLRVEFQITIVNSASNGPRLCAVNVKPAECQALTPVFTNCPAAESADSSSNQSTPRGSGSSSPQHAPAAAATGNSRPATGPMPSVSVPPQSQHGCPSHMLSAGLPHNMQLASLAALSHAGAHPAQFGPVGSAPFSAALPERSGKHAFTMDTNAASSSKNQSRSNSSSPNADAQYVPSPVELAAFESMRRFIEAHMQPQVQTKRPLIPNDTQKSDGNGVNKPSTHIGIVVSPFVRQTDGAGPAPLSGLIVLKSAGVTQNVMFGENDQCGSYLLLPGDLVQFELLEENCGGNSTFKRATRIRLLKSTFEHTHERRHRGIVSTLHVALDHAGKLCGHGRIVELPHPDAAPQSHSAAEYPFTLNELIDANGAGDQPTLRLDDLVEFSVAKFEVDHAVRIVRLTPSSTSRTPQPTASKPDESSVVSAARAQTDAINDLLKRLGTLTNIAQPSLNLQNWTPSAVGTSCPTQTLASSRSANTFEMVKSKTNCSDKQQPARKQGEQRPNSSSPVVLEHRFGFVVALVSGSTDEMHSGSSSCKSGFGFIEFATHEGEIYFSAKACVAADDSSSSASSFRALQLGDAVEMQVQPPLMSTKEAKQVNATGGANAGTSAADSAGLQRENDKCYTRPSAIAVRKIRDWPFGTPDQPVVPVDTPLGQQFAEMRLCETAVWEGTFVGYVRKQMKTCMTYPGVITVTHATARSAGDVNKLNTTGVGFTPLSFLRTAHGQQLTLNVGDRVTFRVALVNEAECLSAAERAAEGKKNCRPVAFAYRAMFVELLERRSFRGFVAVLAKSVEPTPGRNTPSAQPDESAIGSLTFVWPADLRALDVPPALLPEQSAEAPSATSPKLQVAFANTFSIAHLLALGDEVEFSLMYSNSLKRYVASDLKKIATLESPEENAATMPRCEDKPQRARPPLNALPSRVTASRQPRGPPDSNAKGFDNRRAPRQ